MKKQSRFVPDSPQLFASLAISLVLLVVVGCVTRTDPPAAGVVAVVNDENVTDHDIRVAFWFGSDEVRRKSVQNGGRHFLLDYVIGDTLLLQEANKRGISPRFSDVQEFHDRLMKAFLAAEFEPTVSPNDVADEDVRAEYERMSPTLASPETVRIELAYFSERARGEKMLARALGALETQDDRVLDEIMREERDDWPGPLQIPDSGIFSLAEATRFYGEDVAQAAFGMSPPSIIYSELLPYREGWMIMVVPLHHDAVPPPPFEEVESEMRDQVFSGFRERALNRFVDSFRGRHTVVFNEEYRDIITWYEPPPAVPAQIVGPSSSLERPPPGSDMGEPRGPEPPQPPVTDEGPGAVP